MATEYVTQADMDAFRTETRGEFAQLRGEFAQLRGEFGELRGGFSELRAEMKELRGEVKEKFASQTQTLIYVNVGAVVAAVGLVIGTLQLA